MRLVATAALLLGVVLLASVLAMQLLQLSPDTFVAPLFKLMWPFGMGLVVLGALLWTAVWVLMGFVPESQLDR